VRGSLYLFYRCGKLPQVPGLGSHTVAGVERITRESIIEGDSFEGLLQTSRASVALSILLMLLLVAGCGGGGGKQEAQQPPPSSGKASKDGAKDTPKGKDKGKALGADKAGGSTVESKTQAEALKDSSFMLNLRQPILLDFKAAYQRKVRYRRGQ
jgi:hypothetical protein